MARINFAAISGKNSIFRFLSRGSSRSCTSCRGGMKAGVPGGITIKPCGSGYRSSNCRKTVRPAATKDRSSSSQRFCFPVASGSGLDAFFF